MWNTATYIIILYYRGNIIQNSILQLVDSYCEDRRTSCVFLSLDNLPLSEGIRNLNVDIYLWFEHLDPLNLIQFHLTIVGVICNMNVLMSYVFDYIAHGVDHQWFQLNTSIIFFVFYLVNVIFFFIITRIVVFLMLNY